MKKLLASLAITALVAYLWLLKNLGQQVAAEVLEELAAHQVVQPVARQVLALEQRLEQQRSAVLLQQQSQSLQQLLLRW